jgi:predicted transglutaminase-like cysteine proteinase
VKSGDCEDYAITKYYALRDLGIPASDMRIAVVEDTIRSLGHAVLVVFGDGTAFVLDNVSNVIMEHSRLTHYRPQYSVNEEFRWAHVPIKN